MSARYGRKLDVNHAEMVRALEIFGAAVETIQGATPGTPDLLVRIFGVERTAEVKPPGKDLNDNQRKWWVRWGREATILRTPADCAALIAEMRGALTRNEVSTTGEAP